MSNVRGWDIFQPQGPSGKFSAYDNRVVAIVVERVKKNKKDGLVIYLTKATMKALGEPESVIVMTRGSNIGLTKAIEGHKSYKVGRAVNDKEKNGTPFVNLVAFGKSHNITEGVYDAHMEGDVLVFDTQSVPSRV